MATSGRWLPICIDPVFFNLQSTLCSGQSFRWLFHENINEWHGVINQSVWRLRQETPQHPVQFYSNELSETPSDLLDYFRLRTDLSKLIQVWKARDPLFADRVSKLPTEQCPYGVRLLRQDPVETVFAFITSSNNNVSRISMLLNRLCMKFGQVISCDGATHWSFPTLDVLAAGHMEEELRALGFGYRSKFIPAAARWLLDNGGVTKLMDLRTLPKEEAQSFLVNIPGIGNKVADCICLYALDKLDVVPVDIHMLRAARERNLVPIGVERVRSSSLSLKLYRDLSTALSKMWGDYAGWAQAAQQRSETTNLIERDLQVFYAFVQNSDHQTFYTADWIIERMMNSGRGLITPGLEQRRHRLNLEFAKILAVLFNPFQIDFAGRIRKESKVRKRTSDLAVKSSKQKETE